MPKRSLMPHRVCMLQAIATDADRAEWATARRKDESAEGHSLSLSGTGSTLAKDLQKLRKQNRAARESNSTLVAGSSSQAQLTGGIEMSSSKRDFNRTYDSMVTTGSLPDSVMDIRAKDLAAPPAGMKRDQSDEKEMDFDQNSDSDMEEELQDARARRSNMAGSSSKSTALGLSSSTSQRLSRKTPNTAASPAGRGNGKSPAGRRADDDYSERKEADPDPDVDDVVLSKSPSTAANASRSNGRTVRR